MALGKPRSLTHKENSELAVKQLTYFALTTIFHTTIVTKGTYGYVSVSGFKSGIFCSSFRNLASSCLSNELHDGEQACSDRNMHDGEHACSDRNMHDGTIGMDLLTGNSLIF